MFKKLKEKIENEDKLGPNYSQRQQQSGDNCDQNSDTNCKQMFANNSVVDYNSDDSNSYHTISDNQSPCGTCSAAPAVVVARNTTTVGTSTTAGGHHGNEWTSTSDQITSSPPSTGDGCS